MDKLPVYLKPFLWSYDFSKLDKKKDKKTIIFNVLNFGDKKSTDWLFKNYKKEDIKKTISSSLKTSWDKKSISLWSLIFNSKPKDKRF